MMGRGKSWSKKDIDYLNEKWGITSSRFIALQLNRTKDAIIKRAKILKLGPSTTADEYLTANQASLMLNKSYHTIIKWINQKNLKAVRKILCYKRSFYLIKLEDFLQWLMNNQDKYDSRRIDMYALGTEPQWLKEKRKEDRKKYRKLFDNN